MEWTQWASKNLCVSCLSYVSGYTRKKIYYSDEHVMACQLPGCLIIFLVACAVIERQGRLCMACVYFGYLYCEKFTCVRTGGMSKGVVLVEELRATDFSKLCTKQKTPTVRNKFVVALCSLEEFVSF